MQSIHSFILSNCLIRVAAVPLDFTFLRKKEKNRFILGHTYFESGFKSKHRYKSEYLMHQTVTDRVVDRDSSGWLLSFPRIWILLKKWHNKVHCHMG